VSTRDLTPRQRPPHRARVGGEVTLRPDELVIRLHPTAVTEQAAPQRETQTVITRPIPQPLVVWPSVSYRPARWVFDREAVTALVWFALVTAFLVALWLVIP